jgi:hypothetical protein
VNGAHSPGVAFAVTGEPAAASQAVHQSERAGGAPGRCNVVWRIQTPRGAAGSTARTYQDS